MSMLASRDPRVQPQPSGVVDFSMYPGDEDIQSTMPPNGLTIDEFTNAAMMRLSLLRFVLKNRRAGLNELPPVAQDILRLAHTKASRADHFTYHLVLVFLCNRAFTTKNSARYIERLEVWERAENAIE